MSHRVLLVILLFIVTCLVAFGQQTRELAVMLSATVQGGATPSITLHWDADPNGKQIQITRKLKTEAGWLDANAILLDSTTKEWTDVTAEVGVAYDYRVLRFVHRATGKTDTAWYATGYISSGINVLPQRRTRVLIVVDSTMLNALSLQLNVLKGDLENEGWTATVVGSPRAETFDGAKVQRVRDLIKSEHTSAPLGAILFIGRVPVLYSGQIVPDGHQDHIGAWPADGIYGDVDGTYTDASVNSPNTSRPPQNNIPGDGKYDASRFPSDIDIPVGRVDFWNMPAFSAAATNPISEIDLVKRYLNRNHAYRTSSPTIRMGGIIDDHFQGYQDVFAASAWRSFSVFNGDTAVKAGDYFGSLATKPTYLMAYGCGGGNNTGASGIGSTTDMVTNPVHAVFTFLFGSYFGDWDTRDNFLRSSLASAPDALTCAWSGRPHWYMHHMALGESIGYSTRESQNADYRNGYYPAIYFDPSTGSPYTYSTSDRMVHIALLGDPTLRAVMKPVAKLNTITSSLEYPNKVKLSWLRPPGDVDGYLVLRRRGANDNFTLLTPTPIAATSYQDSTRYEGTMEYQVQPVALRSTASGTFYDYGKPASANVIVTSLADASVDNPTSTTLVAAPNPAQSDVSFIVSIDAQAGVVQATTLTVYDMLGRTMWSFDQRNLLSGKHTIGFDASNLAQGRYMVQLTTDGTTTTTPLTIAR